mmetsp:Transcript_5149/g.19293  ORF Transcript_5149/g.19293 Transcript_5149/m.19293 type:complete len:1162 (-) Transcript_5149:160-3645(-)|eukprot:CAMPEP_0117439214 /NCGR_PEP_ID=MMETSP0759-20121206/2452_1 /TAXON_ID=63605 /ORGANISM="Percolomonas cosmopolitus, Strain WS" /LENGTH=1161 /DNA_ID=CAMNT_0005230927 /DNA_START=192 /DNA_END=3677 /DNA_ORIENTATION=+
MTATRRRTTRKTISKKSNVVKDDENHHQEENVEREQQSGDDKAHIGTEIEELEEPVVVKTPRVVKRRSSKKRAAPKMVGMENDDVMDVDEQDSNLAKSPVKEKGSPAAVDDSVHGDLFSKPATPQTLYEQLYTLIIQQHNAIVILEEIFSTPASESEKTPSTTCTSIIGTSSQHDSFSLTLHWNDFTDAQIRKTLLKLFLNVGYGPQLRDIILICMVHEKLNGLLLIHDIVDHMTQANADDHAKVNVNHHFLFHQLSKLLNECYMRFLVKIQHTSDDTLVGYASNHTLYSDVPPLLNKSSSKKRSRSENGTISTTTSQRKNSPHVLYSNFFYTVSWFGDLMTLLLNYAHSFIKTKSNGNQLEKENSHFIGAFFCQLVENVRGKLLWICFRRQHPEIFFKNVAPLLIELSSHDSSLSYIRDLKETLSVIKNSEPTWISPMEYGYISFNAQLPQKAILLVYSLILDQLTTDDIMVTSVSNTLAQLLCIRSIHSVAPGHFLFDVIHAALICSMRVIFKQQHETRREEIIMYSFLYLKLVLLIKEYKKEMIGVQKRLPSIPVEDPLTFAIMMCDKRITDKEERGLLTPLIQRCAQLKLLEESLLQRYRLQQGMPPIVPFEQAAKSIFSSHEHHWHFIQHIASLCKEQTFSAVNSEAMDNATRIFDFICEDPLSLDIIHLQGFIPDLVVALLKVVKVVYKSTGQQNHQSFSSYISALYLIMERFRFRDTPHHKAFLERTMLDLDIDARLRGSLITYLHPQFIHTTTEAQHVGDELLSLLGSPKQSRQFLTRTTPLQILESIPYVTQQWFIALRAQLLAVDHLKEYLVEAAQVCGAYIDIVFYFTLFNSHRHELSTQIPTLAKMILDIGSHTKCSASIIWLRKLQSTFKWFADSIPAVHITLEEMDKGLTQGEAQILSYSKFTQVKGSVEYFNLDKLTEDNMDMKKAVELLKMPKLSQFVFLKQLRHTFSLSAFVRLIFDSFANTVHAEVDQAQRGGYEFGNIVGYNGLKYFLQHMLPCIYQRDDTSPQSEVYAKKLAIFSSYACIRVFSRGNFPCIEGLTHFLRQCLQSDNNVSMTFSLEFLSVLLRLSSLVSCILFSPDSRVQEGNSLALVWKDAVSRVRNRHVALGTPAPLWRDVDVLQFFDFKMIVETKDEEQISLILDLFNE